MKIKSKLASAIFHLTLLQSFGITAPAMYAAAAAPPPAVPADREAPLILAQADLTAFGIEELMEITVTSVSKKSQKIADAAAAIYVITQDDIRRSGVTNIADALRMAPGVQVAKIDSNKWAVSTRGFNGRFANKLLVLMDGRSLYNPFFLGVYWEVQDTVLDDIERIEVIRGPGAALWGSNAVNGVINIITKSADKTEGTLISAGSGSYEQGFATVRQGTAISDNTNLRLYAKHQQRDGFADATGKETYDDWHTTQGGFRLDSKLTSQNSLTIQGDYYDGQIKETYLLYNLPTPSNPLYSHFQQSKSSVSGGNILTRFQKSFSDTNSFSVQSYYEYSEYNMLVAPEKFNTVDLEFQHRFSFSDNQDLVWGGGYRFSRYDINNSATISFEQQRVKNNLYSAFIHDEIRLIPDRLSLILGSRIEQNDNSGFDLQPNGRLLWTVTPHDSVWAAVSRAVRSATKGEQTIQYNYRTIPPNTGPNTAPIPLRLEIVGNPGFKSEELLAYEIGYRTEPLAHLSIDIAAYYNSYSKLRVISPGTPYTEPAGGFPANAVIPFYLSNDMHGHAVGAELSVDWRPAYWWRLQGSYGYQNLTMYLDGPSTDKINKGNAEGDVPQNQVSLRSGFDIGRQVTLDLWLRGVDHLPSIDGNQMPGYIAIDARIAWKPFKELELALIGQNLLDNHHPEFIPEYVNTVSTEVPRSLYGKVTWQF